MVFNWKESLAIVTTETLIRWHRKGFKFYWHWKSRGGRPALPTEIRQLIASMVKENVTWGEERIASELSLKLGIYVSPRTVGKYWPKQPGSVGRRRTSSQHWRTFVKNPLSDPCARLHCLGLSDRRSPSIFIGG